MWEGCTRAYDNATWVEVDVPSSAMRHLPASKWMKQHSKDVERRCNTETAVTAKTMRKARRTTTKITAVGQALWVSLEADSPVEASKRMHSHAARRTATKPPSTS